MNRHSHLSSTRVGLRCDGNAQIGLGHIVGCIRLARLMTKTLGIEAEFVVRASPVAETLIRNAGFPGTVIPEDTSPQDDIHRLMAEGHRRSWSGIVINFCKDDLERYADLFPRIKADGFALIFMDNPIPPACWTADLLINALPHPPYPGYDPARHPACLDGLAYFLLDDAHERLRARPRQIRPQVERVLIAMGGGDADNTSAKIIEALHLVDFDGEVDIVLGAANPHQDVVRRLFVSTGLKGSVNVACTDLAERIAAADLGFSALGLTTYEMAALGLPVLIISSTPLNAEAANQYASQYGAAEHLGSASDRSTQQIASSFDCLRKDEGRRLALSVNGSRISSQASDVVFAITKTLATSSESRRTHETEN